MLAPFAALLPRQPDASYDDLERAAKALRADPGNYQPVAGVSYELQSEALFAWEIEQDGVVAVRGLVGVWPLEGLIPHEQTTSAALTRPRHPVQIRPVMALVDDELPATEPSGPPRSFGTTHRHTVTPVRAPAFAPSQPVIADGHHRVAAARRVGGDPGIMVMMVSTAGATLQAGAFHRAFAHPVPIPSSIEGARLVEEEPDAALAGGRLAIVTPDGSVGVEVDPDRLRPHTAGIPAAEAHQVVLPALGLDEADAVYLDDVDAALAAAQYGTAVLLSGARVEAVVAAARAGSILPPKSTRFRPKPVRGFLMRPL